MLLLFHSQEARQAIEEERAELLEWGTRLQALTKGFDVTKQEVAEARSEIELQRQAVQAEAAALVATQLQLEEQRQQLAEARFALDRCGAMKHANCVVSCRVTFFINSRWQGWLHMNMQSAT